MFDSIINELFNSFTKKDYKKIISIIYWIYIFIAPSYIGMFLFYTEIFNKLDILKLLILCIAFNLILVFILLMSIYAYLEIKMKCKNENLDDYLFKEAVIRLKAIILVGTIVMIGFKIYLIKS